MIGLRLYHLPTKNQGECIKEYTPTGRSLTYQIRLDNGKIYYAPASEFRLMTCNIK